jgi:hypothetical protein
MENPNDRLAFAEKGLEIYSAGENSSDKLFCSISVLEESVISISNVANSDAIVSLTLSAGSTLYGVFSGISVTSGKIVAYKR